MVFRWTTKTTFDSRLKFENRHDKNKMISYSTRNFVAVAGLSLTIDYWNIDGAAYH